MKTKLEILVKKKSFLEVKYKTLISYSEYFSGSDSEFPKNQARFTYLEINLTNMLWSCGYASTDLRFFVVS